MENSGNNLSAVDKVINYVKTKPIRSVLIFVFIVLPVLSAIFGTHSKKEKVEETYVSAPISQVEDKTKKVEADAEISVPSTNELPKFVLACGYGDGVKTYRVVSDGSAIYYATTSDLDATRKSTNLKIRDKVIEWDLTTKLAKESNSMRLHRDTLNLYKIENDEKMLKYIAKEELYNCQSIDDSEITTTMKLKYENSPGIPKLENKI